MIRVWCALRALIHIFFADLPTQLAHHRRIELRDQDAALFVKGLVDDSRLGRPRVAALQRLIHINACIYIYIMQ